MKLKWTGLPLAALLLAPAGALAAKHHTPHHAATRHAMAKTASVSDAVDLLPTANPERHILLAAAAPIANLALVPTANPMRPAAITLAAATTVDLAPTPNPIEQIQLTDAVAMPDTSSAAPIVQWPLQKLSCVPYARLRSGFAIFGDARLWWEKAKNVYAQLADPVTDAVMVFAGSARLSHGHVAVVSQIVSPREIKVDHANWQNKGEIDLNMPVLDVSAKNDWSQVRVWNVQTNSFGSRVYAISGFITRAKATNLAP